MIDIFSFILIFVIVLLAITLYVLYINNTNTNKKLQQQNDMIQTIQEQNHQKSITIAKQLQQLELLDETKEQNSSFQDQLIVSKQLNSTLQTKLQQQKISFDEKLKLMLNNEQIFIQKFENLSNEIIDKSQKKLQDENKKSLEYILSPVKIQLSDFKKKVEDIYEKDTKDRLNLSNELKELKELNLQMSKEANNLTSALRHDNKTQGSWGEIVLDRVLENSGLRLNHEYKRQISLKDANDKQFQPDVVVYLPDDRQIIIDAKTSLVSYNLSISCEDETQRQNHIKNHTISIKNHIKGLSKKKYEELKGINSLDFIFMFIPIESALLIAMETDVNLFDEAFKQKIILVSPSTLLVALRAVENSWRYEKQAKSITKVYSRAEELYKKFVGFVDDMDDIGKHINRANDSYENAYSKLSKGQGSLVRQATMLKDVSNIKPKKELKAVDYE
ncbi:MAG: hypothetical protein B1H07_00160 [Campylobacteraceae bacterium 4484_166]|nr:MAG: hypothetical protein B1H07_00160 [Campylobacteraceae bacterium 4484_166]